ncbi:hypothetical protein BCON_0940g00030 [Botryotinia convoluta]|uniref:Uncharacterized protein n=1 Tax=Botryotinia convoluta TaxID=54673 RepID=A0A4Z1HFG6_9HELO|nr:hypothetical protein BCON_0940g00030 [Botryotinia convoluta]
MLSLVNEAYAITLRRSVAGRWLEVDDSGHIVQPEAPNAIGRKESRSVPMEHFHGVLFRLDIEGTAANRRRTLLEQASRRERTPGSDYEDIAKRPKIATDGKSLFPFVWHPVKKKVRRILLCDALQAALNMEKHPCATESNSFSSIPQPKPLLSTFNEKEKEVLPATSPLT